jgi:hypothetical protein
MQPQDIGRAIRDAQLNLFEARDTAFLTRCRVLAVEVARSQGTVSINDIRAGIELPAQMHPSVLGAVFKTKQFKAVGFTEATHPQAHARVVRVYQLTNQGETNGQ